MEQDGGVEERPTKRVKLSPDIAADLKTTPPSALEPKSRHLNDAVVEKEVKVGITVFVRQSAILLQGRVKKRYTDFLVNEILPGGQVLHLKKITADPEVIVAEEDQQDDSTVSTEVAPSGQVAKQIQPETSIAHGSVEHATNGNMPTIAADQVSDEDKAKLALNLNEKAVTEILQLYSSIVRHPKKKPKEHPTVRTEFTSDRTIRAHIHQDIRRIFNSKIDSSTTHEGILVLSAVPPRNNARPNKPKPNKLSWQERGGEHCHFTLYKENKDTMEAISLLARFMKMNPKELSFAGTKDRRAATVQRVSTRRVDAERLAALNRTLRMVAVGDFQYSPREIGLGDLEGNEFTITLRDCDIVFPESQVLGTAEKMEKIHSHLTQAMADLHNRGFINYFGLQRFGTFATRSDSVGLKLLSSDFEGACNAILEYSPTALANTDAEESTNHVGREDRARAEAIKMFYETDRVKDSLNIMPRRFSAESALIRHLGKHPRDFLTAILSIQHGMRTMYVHAYQSMVWNAAASERWRLFGDQVVEGDLVLVREHTDKQANAATEASIDADGEVIVQAGRDDRARQAHEVFERARALTHAEAQSGQYTVFDLVLPQPGFDVMYPDNASGAFYSTFMASEAGGKLDPRDMRRKQREFSLSGAYRKILARIGEDWHVDVRSYVRDEESFVATDWEKIKGAAAAAAEGATDDLPTDIPNPNTIPPPPPPLQHHQQQEEQLPQDPVPDKENIAAILKFQLATSQYATMALRELSAGGVVEYKPEFSGGR